jgi:hypothetical protein
MIVFDENVHQQRIMESVAAWYRGRVLSVRALRPGTVIRDEAIPTLLRAFRQPTFVTTNVSDFWRRIPAHPRYCVVCVAVPNDRVHEIPQLLRQLLRMLVFKTKATRMGKVIRVSHAQIHYYDVRAERIIHMRGWSI